MPDRIALELRTVREEKGFAFKRFRCSVLLETNPHDQAAIAIVDTGAHFSIIPRHLWAEREGLIEFAIGASDSGPLRTIRGIGEAELPCSFGWLRIILADSAGNFSEWLRIPAKLALTDSVPLVLGVAEVLDKYEVVLNGEEGCYIRIPCWAV